MAHVWQKYRDKTYDATLIIETWPDGKVTFSIEGEDRVMGVQLGRKRVGKLHDFLGATFIKVEEAK